LCGHRFPRIEGIPKIEFLHLGEDRVRNQTLEAKAADEKREDEIVDLEGQVADELALEKG
jgi:hypothetical protein